MFHYTAVIHEQVKFALVPTAALGLSQMADDRCPQLLLPLVGAQSLPPDKKKKLSFQISPQCPTSPTCPNLIFTYNLFSIFFCLVFLSVYLLYFTLLIYCSFFSWMLIKGFSHNGGVYVLSLGKKKHGRQMWY